MTIFQFSFGDGFAGSAKIALLSSKLLQDRGHKVIMFLSKGSLTEKRAFESEISFQSMDEKAGYKNLISEIDFHYNTHKPDIIIGHHSLDRKIGITLKRKHKEFINIAYRHNITKTIPIIGSFIYNHFTDYLIACSRGVELSLINSGIKNNKIKTIYNGISIPEDLDRISGENIKNQISADGKVVLGLSTWFHKERKGFDILFNAFSKLNSSFVLLLVGIPQNQQEEVLEYASEFEIDRKRIIMPGYVENIWQYYKAMDIFLLPSRSEGFSLALLEAAAVGLPIIASDIPGNNEFIEDNINGFLFNIEKPDSLKEKIEVLVADKLKSNALALSAKEKVFNYFTIQHYADNLNKFLSDALLHKNRR